MKTLKVKITNGGQMNIEGSQIEEFKQSLRGELIQPEDKSYDNARKLYNAMIDKRPALIAGLRQWHSET